MSEKEAQKQNLKSQFSDLEDFGWMDELSHHFSKSFPQPAFQIKLPESIIDCPVSKGGQIAYDSSSVYLAYITALQEEVIIFDYVKGSIVTKIQPLNTNTTIVSISFHPLKKAIFLGLSCNIVEFWDLNNEKLVSQYKCKSTNSSCVDLKCSISGRYILCASNNGQITLFNTEDPSSILTNKNDLHSDLANISITDNEETIISSSFSEIRIWDIKNLDKCLTKIRIQSETHSLPIIVSPTNKHFYIDIDEYTIAVYSIKTKEILKVIEGNKKMKIAAYVITSDEKVLIALMRDNSFRFFDLVSMQEATSFKLNISGQLRGFLLPPNNNFLAVILNDSSVQSWNLFNEMKRIFNLNEILSSKAQTFVTTKDQNYLIARSKEGEIQLINLKQQKVIFSIEKASHKEITTMILTNDEKNLIIGNSENGFTVYSFQEAKLLEQYKSPSFESGIIELKMICNDDYLGLRLTSNKLYLFDLKKRQIQQTLEGYWWRAKNIYNQLNGQQQTLTIGADDGTLNILELKDQSFILRESFRNLFPTPITALGVVEDFIIAGSSQGSLKIIFFKKNVIQNFECQKGKRGEIHSIDITTDSAYAVSASSNNISLYDTRLLLEIHSITTTSEIRKVTFTSDSKGIVILYVTGNIEILKLPFFSDLNIIDYTLPVPYRALSTIPKFKVMRLWNSDIKITPHLIQSFSALYTNPYKINFWHYYFLTQDLEESSSVVKMMIDANIPILNDMNGKNIIHYLLKKKNKTALNIIFKHAEQAFQHSPPEVFDSFSLLLPEIIATDVCVGPPEVVEGRHLPRFGDATGKTPFVLSSNRKLMPEIKRKLVKEGADPLTFYTSKISFDSDFSSDENVKLLEIIYNYHDTTIYNSGLILKYIDCLWIKARPSLCILIFDSFLFLAFLLTYTALEMSPFWLEMVVFSYNCVMLFHEFLQFVANSKIYVRSFWNFLDLLRLAFVFSSMALRWKNDINPEDPNDGNGLDDTVAAMLSTAFFLNYIKTITFLRVFTATRRFIRLLVQVIQDMLPFIVLLAVIIVAFSFIFFQLDQDLVFVNVIPVIYRMLFGDFDSTSDYSTLEWTFFILISFLCAVVLMNLLVAFLGGTYGRVMAHDISSDNYEKIDLLLEFIHIKKTLKRILCLNRRKKVGTRASSPRKFLFWVIETSADDETNVNFEWGSQIRQSKKEFRKEVTEENKNLDKQLDYVLKNLEAVRDVQKLMKKITKKQDQTANFVALNSKTLKKEILLFKKKINMDLDTHEGKSNVKIIHKGELKGISKDVLSFGTNSNL